MNQAGQHIPTENKMKTLLLKLQQNRWELAPMTVFIFQPKSMKQKQKIKVKLTQDQVQRK